MKILRNQLQQKNFKISKKIGFQNKGKYFSSPKETSKTHIHTHTHSHAVKAVTKRPKVVVLGSGWAGYRFLSGLDKDCFDVYAVSPRNHFIFTPLLASTTVGTLEFRAILEPTRMACKNYIKAECKEVNAENNKVVLYDSYTDRSFDLDYDYLVIACGAVPNTFGTPGVKEYCHFLRQVPDARAIRKQIMTCFEEASSPLLTLEEKKKLLSFIVVGGGPTSCEFSAELHDFITTDFKKWFPQVSADTISMTVIESTDHILGMFDRRLSEYAEKHFEREGVKLLTNTKVKEVRKGELVLDDGSILPFGLCVWSTGNAPSDFVKSLNFNKDKRTGRILVDEHLKVNGQKNIYAIGDCATQEGSSLPQTAQCAQQEGVYLYKLFNLLNEGVPIESNKDFKYNGLGIMTYIGDYNAIVDLKSSKIRGHIAWFLWRSAYLTKLLSVRNMILVPMYWFKAFVFGRDISTF